ncbi:MULTISPECIES: hypothetical protein [unclassified Streptomyces]|uniref:hypothetical protein n=1 Tax=Streptomyces sp. SID5594 TaxID=2690304 RepID=UPI001F492815|nr:hypothetical protein [Streptomyces sp. ScaeMP-e10]
MEADPVAYLSGTVSVCGSPPATETVKKSPMRCPQIRAQPAPHPASYRRSTRRPGAGRWVLTMSGCMPQRVAMTSRPVHRWP